MTIKFNFYDIYGFALPGFLLLAVLWLPIGLVENKWPTPELSSAVIGVILAYIAGHVLQTVAQHALPSSLRNGRYPSNVFLDDNDRTFSDEFKRRLAQQIRSTFDLDVMPNASDGAADGTRRDAFFLCRSALIKSKTVVYPEQFEGLYALMRGLSAAFAVAVVYYFGWAYSSFRLRSTFAMIGLSAMIVAIIAATVFTRMRYAKAALVMAAFTLIAAFAAGYFFGAQRVLNVEDRMQLVAAAVFSFFAAERCYAGYRAFAEEFAKAVYRDFSNYEKPDGAEPSHPTNSGSETH